MRLPLLLALIAAFAATSCAHAQDEPDEDKADAPAPKKAPKKVAKRAQPKTLHVKAGASNGGDGTPQKPFATLQSAIDSAQGGDTVVVAAGTYEGSITVNADYPDDAPLTICAAEGAQPVISGMKPVTGWKPGPNGLYTTKIEGKAESLFAGAARLALGSWPKVDGKWINVASVDTATKKLLFTGEAPPELGKNTKLYTFSKTKATYQFRGIQGLEMNGANGSVALDEKTAQSIKEDKVNRFTFFNSPSFITAPDEWAVEYPDVTHSRFTFRPRDPKQLQTTQYRAGTSGIRFEGTSNVRLSGFIVTGMNGGGIGVRKAKKITIEDCVLYNNENGIGARDIQDFTVRRCLIMQNYWGITLSDANRVLVEDSEIAFNDEDGFRISGRIFDKNSFKIGSSDVEIRRCYIHHHQYQGHPDNIQFFRGVGRVKFDSNLLMYGGQQMMMEQTADMELTNSVVLASINRSLNLFTYKKAGTPGWTLKNNTIGYTRYNPVYVGGQQNLSSANLFFQFQQPAVFPPDALQANHDWFSPRPTNGKSVSLTVDKTARILQTSDLGAKAGLEANGNIGDPKLRNVPASMNIAFGSGGSTPERLTFDIDATANYTVGDLIEINGDGIPRTIKTVAAEAITFTPALPASPFRYSCVFNWKSNPNFQLDTRPTLTSPLLTAGPNNTPTGSPLEIAAYQKGDFNGDGKRDLPTIPAELAAMLTDRPNRYIFPYSM